MNLGDGLLFELENGKPRLILLSRAAEKNPVKQFSFRSRAAAAVLSSRQPPNLEPLPPVGTRRSAPRGPGGANANTPTTNKKLELQKPLNKLVSKRQKLKPQKGDRPAAAVRVGGRTEPPEVTATHQETGSNGSAGPERGRVSRTNEQLQRSLDGCHPEKVGAEPGVGGAPGNIKSGVEPTESGGGEPAISISAKDYMPAGLLCFERRTASRAEMEAKKAEWRRELDAQVALKHLQQQQSDGLQAAEHTHGVLSGQNLKELPAAIRSSLRIEEATDRRRQTGAASPSAPPAAVGSSLSLLWEVSSSEGGAGSNKNRTRTSYLRSMTSLLDPAQIEERERRRRKQQEQQRAIEAQMEERRHQREQEERERRREQEEEERRLQEEREQLQRLYELDVLKERQKAEHKENQEEPREENQEEPREENQEEPREENQEEPREENQEEPREENQEEPREENQEEPREEKHESTTCAGSKVRRCEERSGSSLRDSSVQTDEPPTGGGKENMYQASVHSERSRRDQRRPEWNMQRPSRRFVPASERYPITLQRARQESRQQRQAELLALQGRSLQSKAQLPPSPPPPPDEERLLYSDSSSKMETDPTGRASNRGPSPLLPTHTPALEFIPYIRTDEIFNLDPLEPAETPPPSLDSGGTKGVSDTNEAGSPSQADPEEHLHTSCKMLV